MAYGKKVMDHYENPRNVGVLDKDASNEVQEWLELLLVVTS